MKIHTILILAGGDGGRFAPLEHKMQFKFNGKTVLQHIVASVSDFAEQIIVVVNKANELLIKSDLSACKVNYVTQLTDEGGMADAVLAAEHILGKDILVLNANDVFDFSLIPSLVEQTKKEASPVGFVAKKVDTYFPGGYVIFKDEKAVGLVEKPLPENVPSSFVRLVADYFPEPQLFIQELKKLPPSDDQNEKAMTILMKQKPATCFKYEGDWATLKFPWHVLSMQEYFFSHDLKNSIHETVQLHKTSSIEGTVFMGKNTKIGAYCKIVGPCYIGENVIVGDHSLLRSSVVEDDTLIGSGCEVARSYLSNGVMLHRNYVGDSVLSESVTMGAGAVTANYRFDGKAVQTPIKGVMINTGKGKLGLIAGKSVKIGVNSSTYPGVKLNPGVMVLPGEVVRKDR